MIPSGRGIEGNLLPQEEINDSSAVCMWLFFFGGRRWTAGKKEVKRKGKGEEQEPRLLANLGRRKGTNSFASSQRSGSSKTIPGNLLFLACPPPHLLQKCRQDVVINNQKGRKVPGRVIGRHR